MTDAVELWLEKHLQVRQRSASRVISKFLRSYIAKKQEEKKRKMEEEEKQRQIDEEERRRIEAESKLNLENTTQKEVIPNRMLM